MLDKEEHDMLIRIDQRVAQMEKWATNHDVHHFCYNVMAWGVALSAIVALIVVLIGNLTTC